ncbi:carbonic anhydrase 1-like [Babylonia areolata]|uniref:carbonic anhydrase 1-like n=1 Tax=Babylonia areolata TaxID=304850 RepID=UPI003FD0BADC
MQSPINIDTSRALFDTNLQSFDLRQYNTCNGCTMMLENVDGHTVEVKYGGNPITIRGGSLPDDYLLDQFHFHWGASDDVGSEHRVDNKIAPMEMHIVHHMKKFNKSVSAVNPYGLAVLGFFFQIGDHNSGFDQLLSNFPDVIYKDAHKSITPFHLWDLVSTVNQSYYYRYFGSLTTPPCYETVIWTLFKDKITISQDQLNTFRTLLSRKAGDVSGEEDEYISDDFRPLQPLHERSVTSNDPALLGEVGGHVVSDLLEDIKQLKQRCSSTGAPAARADVVVVGAGVVLYLLVCLSVCRFVPWEV